MAAHNVKAARNLQVVLDVRVVHWGELVTPHGEYRDDSDRHVGAGY